MLCVVHNVFLCIGFFVRKFADSVFSVVYHVFVCLYDCVFECLSVHVSCMSCVLRCVLCDCVLMRVCVCSMLRATC